MRAKFNRKITSDEMAVLSAALLKVSTGSDGSVLLSTIADLRVVGGCTCGCASVDFERPADMRGKPIADGFGRTANGDTVGVIVWGDDTRITGLEIYGLGDEVGNSLPVPDSIREF